MEGLSTLFVLLDSPWFALAALGFAVAVLETERRWVRARRRRGIRRSLLAQVLDMVALLAGSAGLIAGTRSLFLPLILRLDRGLVAPLLWALGLVLILTIGLALIRRFAPTPRS